jgi:hypothetical protein
VENLIIRPLGNQDVPMLIEKIEEQGEGIFNLESGTRTLNENNHWYKFEIEDTIIGYGSIKYDTHENEIQIFILREFRHLKLGPNCLRLLEEVCTTNSENKLKAIILDTNPELEHVARFFIRNGYTGLLASDGMRLRILQGEENVLSRTREALKRLNVNLVLYKELDRNEI